MPFDIQKKQRKNAFLHWTCFYRFSFAKRSRHVVFSHSTEKKDSNTLFFGLQKYKIILIKRKFIRKYIWLFQYILLNINNMVCFWRGFCIVYCQVFAVPFYYPGAIYTSLVVFLYNFEDDYLVKTPLLFLMLHQVPALQWSQCQVNWYMFFLINLAFYQLFLIQYR